MAFGAITSDLVANALPVMRSAALAVFIPNTNDAVAVIAKYRNKLTIKFYPLSV
jgi:FAD/FMN-containing dehydrogenase